MHRLDGIPGGRLTCTRVLGTAGANGLEYLGFRFDGRAVHLRDATLSNLYRIVTRAAVAYAIACRKRYPDKDSTAILNKINNQHFVEKFGRVDDFKELSDDYREGTFWNYARRCSELFGPDGKNIMRQLRQYNQVIRDKVTTKIVEICK